MRGNSTYDDSKLRQIIETSNMGMAHQLEKQKRHIDKTQNDSARLAKIERQYKLSQKEAIEKIQRGNSGGLKTKNTEKEPDSGLGILDILLQLRLKVADLATTLTSATKALNDVTGYTSIEKLKMAVEKLENELKGAKAELKQAKVNYSDAIQRRSDLQKEINELLTRKHSWTPEDLERFTELYRNDHQNQQDEHNAELQLEDAETKVDAVQVKLTQLILTRYHEEQIWSDKIRQALTWGTWMLMGVNVLVFTVATFFVEPWKRRKLVDAFHREVQEKLDEFTGELQELSSKLDGGKEKRGKGGKDSGFWSQFGGDNVEKEGNVKVEKQKEALSSSSGSSFPLTFGGIGSWMTLKDWARRTFFAVTDPKTQAYHLTKSDFEILSALLLGLGSSLGAALMYIIISHK